LVAAVGDDLVAQAGIPRACPDGNARGVLRTFHSVRHTFARVVLENGRHLTWVSRHMGHSSLSVTTDVYGHWSTDAAKKEAEAMEGAFGKI
jgi:integrase